MLERGMAIAVVSCTLLRVLENLVRFVDFLEAVFGFLITRIAIRMVLHGLFAERRLDVGLARGAIDRQSFVVTALGH